MKLRELVQHIRYTGKTDGGGDPTRPLAATKKDEEHPNKVRFLAGLLWNVEKERWAETDDLPREMTHGHDAGALFFIKAAHGHFESTGLMEQDLNSIPMTDEIAEEFPYFYHRCNQEGSYGISQ